MFTDIITIHIVSLFIILQYWFFSMMVGAYRQKTGIKAPATSGNFKFQCAYRIQLNTLEQLPLVLPLMYICASVYRIDIAAIFGAFFFIGRILYAISYMKDPTKRGMGMMIGFLGQISLLVCCIIGFIQN